MLKIYNSFTKQKEEFKPLTKGYASLYVCGPTVYGMPHLGHARSYVNFDVVYRFLKYNEYEPLKVKYIQNITDVGHLVGDGDSGEDKIAKQSKIENLDAYEIAYKYECEYFKYMDLLNIERPSVSARVTGFIPEMVDMVQRMIDNGYGYVTKEGNVYFDVYKAKNYGELTNRKLGEGKSGERIEGELDKLHPEDFAIWKAVDKNTLMKWKNPWSEWGVPGWHLECSALAYKFFGERFDIHGGGLDNIFPHHECECLQNQAAFGHHSMQYFMHNNLITINGTKMGKSLGNSITLKTLLEDFDPNVIRLFILSFHYRSPIDFTTEALKLVKEQYGKIADVYTLVSKSQETKPTAEINEIYSNMITAMNDDFNTAVAFAEVLKLVKLAGKTDEKDFGQILYVYNKFITKILGLTFKTDATEKTDKNIPETVTKLADKRIAAKQNKDYAKADEIRKQVQALGYNITDNKEGYKITKI